MLGYGRATHYTDEKRSTFTKSAHERWPLRT